MAPRELLSTTLSACHNGASAYVKVNASGPCEVTYVCRPALIGRRFHRAAAGHVAELLDVDPIDSRRPITKVLIRTGNVSWGGKRVEAMSKGSSQIGGLARRLLALPTLLLLFLSSPAEAWDGIISGKIGAVEVAYCGNYDFRVYAGGLTQDACGAGTTAWSYLNQSDANYQAYISTITSAYIAGKSVTIYVTKDANGANCHIGFISVAG
jgi:hypothetical protein